MSKRDNSFDFIKGVLIILVVLGHALQTTYGNNCWNDKVYHAIYSFHMPLFIFVSGYFFKSSLRMNFMEMATHKFKRLLIPTIFFTSILLVIKFFANGATFKSLWDIYMVCRTYWYLICLFILSIIYYLYIRANKTGKVTFVAIYIFLLLFYEKLPTFILIDCQVIRMTLIMGLGVFYGMHHAVINEYMAKKHIALIAIVIILFEVSLVRLFYGINLLGYPPMIRILDGISCSMIAFIMLKFLYSWAEKNLQFLCTHILRAGKNSMGIYLIHILFLRYISYNHITFDYFPDLISIILLFITTYIISIWLTDVIRETLFKKYLLGE